MNSLEGTIDRFEDDLAVIKLETGTTLLWPKANMASDLHEGSVIKISLGSNLTQTAEAENLAKNVLNEILTNE